MREVDIKLLWSLAAGRCSICREVLTQDSKATSSKFHIGQQAHIVGEKQDAARWTRTFDEKEAGKYHNLILLCPNCHAKIDNVESRSDFPVEELHRIKIEHELWVRDHLGMGGPKIDADQIVYACLVDLTVKTCQLENWQNWTSWALSSPPRFRTEILDGAEKYAQAVLSANFSGKYPKLERCLQLLSRGLSEFTRHCLRNQGVYVQFEPEEVAPIPFYKIEHYDEILYRELGIKWDRYLERCAELVYFLTKVANWLAQEVRDAINPMFFLTEGKFLIVEGPFLTLDFRTSCLEFTDEEKCGIMETLGEEIPQILLELMDLRQPPFPG